MKKTQRKREHQTREIGEGRAVANPLVTAFAARLKTWRRAEKMPLKPVAEELGVCVSIVCEWEHAHRFPSIDNLWAISKLTGIPAWKLIQPMAGSEAKQGRPAPRKRR